MANIGLDQNLYGSKVGIKILDANYTIEPALRCVLAENSVVVTLPPAAEFPFYPVYIRLVASGTLTIARSGSDNIRINSVDAASISTNTPGAWIMLEHDLDTWHVVQDSGDFI